MRRLVGDGVAEAGSELGHPFLADVVDAVGALPCLASREENTQLDIVVAVNERVDLTANAFPAREGASRSSGRASRVPRP